MIAQLIACTVGRSVLAPREDATTPDVEDAPPEAAAEVGIDAEAGVDAGPDVAPDVAPDLAAEVGPDAADDAEVGVDATEAGVDATEVGADATEVGVDAPLDTPECPTGQVRCGPGCVSTQTDAMNCGACGMACPGAANGMAACVAGACAVTCNTGFTLCGGACIHTQTDAMHCGGCSNRCAAPTGGATSCAMGACRPTCPGSQVVCDGACVDVQTSTAHCGRCGNACAAGQGCVGGSCACPLGQMVCAGACVNLTSDSLHCGMCNRACPTGQVCRTGTCQSMCASGSTLCGTQCVTLGDNVNHCGRCDNRCAADQTCASGACVTVVTIDPVGCADGTREAFTDRTMYPNIAACSGPWALPGIFPAIPASTLAACATLGNSSMTAPANGAGCSASNLCARGWRICNGGDVLPRTRNMGCAATTYPTDTFYAAAVSGTGCAICALRTGTVTGALCTSNTCTANCRESGDLNNDFFGCGTLGGGVSGACDGLDRFSDNNCGALGPPWSCGGDVMESRTVTKSAVGAGGVLCCRD